MKTYITILLFFCSFALFAQQPDPGNQQAREITTNPLVLPSETLQGVLQMKFGLLKTYESDFDATALAGLRTRYREVRILHNAIYQRVAREVAARHVWEKNPRKHSPDLLKSLDAATAEANKLNNDVGALLATADLTAAGIKPLNPTAILAGFVLLKSIYEKLQLEVQCPRAAAYYQTSYWLTLEEIHTGKPNDINWSLVLSNDCAKIITRRAAKADKD